MISHLWAAGIVLHCCCCHITMSSKIEIKSNFHNIVFMLFKKKLKKEKQIHAE
jgi:hypothetical protein